MALMQTRGGSVAGVIVLAAENPRERPQASTNSRLAILPPTLHGWAATGTAPPMATSPPTAPAPAKRLKFIDMARSVAILLMLEGHFISATLVERARDSPNALQIIWSFFRGMAAPLFFTAAGIVFVYLLTAHNHLPLRQNPRVAKGLKRSLALITWGYLLQASLWQTPNYLHGQFNAWLSAFHVLQAIGVGLLVLIGIFAVQQNFRRLPLPLCYLGAGLLVLWLHGYLLQLAPEEFFPDGAPAVIQNMFKGPQSAFPLAPWLAFSLGGGAIGAMLRRFRAHLEAPWFPLTFLAAGGFLEALAAIARSIGAAYPDFAPAAAGDAWICSRAGEILLLLGILLAIEQRFEVKDSWFMRIGQYTFPIYILHAVILYGAILGGGFFGDGLAAALKNSLSPIAASIGAILFIAFFVLLIPFIDFSSSLLNRLFAGLIRTPPADQGPAPQV
jgi:uncharacterized membrane protein